MDDRGTWFSWSMRVGGDARAECLSYALEHPILIVHGGGGNLAISPASRREDAVTARDVEFARQLVNAAGAYLAELERLRDQNAEGAAGTERAA
ncbi:hypothetical protein ACQP1W_01080 [Spirillospora sp. CA-255316]